MHNVDENIQECKEGKQLATILIAKITSLDTDPDSTGSVKEMMLPLQGPKLWHQWVMTKENIDMSTVAPLAFNSIILRRKRKRLLFARNSSLSVLNHL